MSNLVDKPKFKKFSKQETKVFTLLIQEYKIAEIAKILALDERTICTYKFRLLKKSGAKTIIGLYLFNEKNKLVDIKTNLK